MKRDGTNKSIWQDVDLPVVDHTGDLPNSCDVVVIGGGITGLTTALLLQQQGLKCVVAEAKNIGFGTTGGTTAHLNTIFDTPYYRVQDDFGKEDAELYAQGGVEAISLVEGFCKTFGINAGFSKKTGFFFATDAKQAEELEKIVTSAKEVGLPMDFINDSPFPIPYEKIAAIEGQAQVHSTQYLSGLAMAFRSLGGIILENCRVTGITDKDTVEVETSQGKIMASQAVYATHIPPGVNILHFRCAPYRSYAIACTLKDDKYPDALGYDLETPYHYYRTQEVNGKKYLIAGGEDHKTGHEENTDQCFRRLEAYISRYYDISEVNYRWSSQYFESTDGLPYIGKLPGTTGNVYVATGFIGNGMTLGTLAGKVISDLILAKESPYKKLFNPSRVKPVAGFQDFVKESADVVQRFIADKIKPETLKELTAIAPGEAKVVRADGQLIALYRDEQNHLHAVNSACTHVKCTVGWNNSEKTWDCPCHGSRFSMDGEMLTAPARKDLEKINLKNLD